MSNKKETENEQQGNSVQNGGTDTTAEAEKIISQAKADAAEILAEAKAEREKAEKLLADAKAEAAKAEEAAKSAALTAAEPASKPASRGDELVPVRLFRDNGKYKDDVFVAVNGERVQIRRGETVLIKRKFAEVLERSMNQDAATAALIEQESSRYASEAQARGL